MLVGLLLLTSYFLGTLPFGVWISGLRGVDILARGSGNIGATNVAREVGAAASLLVFVFDALKGFVPAFVGGSLLGDGTFSPEWSVVCGIGAILGHSFSPLLSFKGGKGVATSLGVVFAATPIIGLLGLVVFLASMVATQWVSLSSLLACISLPIFCEIRGSGRTLALIYAALAVYILTRHRGNINRLLIGTEPKFRFKRRK